MNIKHKRIHRIRITGPKDDLEKAFDYIWRNGYRITRSGPKIRADGRADVSRIVITAEKEEG